MSTTSPSDAGGPAVQNDSGATVYISIRDETGNLIDTRTVKRSFPNAKPTKLVNELERLLSVRPISLQLFRDSREDGTDANTVTDGEDPILAADVRYPREPPAQQLYRRQWKLADEGNGVHTTLLVAEGVLNRFMELLGEAADQLHHHPHIARSRHEFVGDSSHENDGSIDVRTETHTKNQNANANESQIENGTENRIKHDSRPWIVHILNTTHKPAGMSLKDVRLADKIDEIITTLNSESTVSPTSLTETANTPQPPTYPSPSPPPSSDSAPDKIMTRVIEYMSDRSENKNDIKIDTTIQSTIQDLEEQNTRAAKEAVSNPDSKCALHL